MPADSFDAFKAFQNEVPEAGYFSYRDKARSPNQRRFFDQQFASVQNQFIGRVGQMARGGQDPSQFNWTDFLSDYFSPGGGSSVDWMEQPSRRSGGTRFNPPVQFNYGTQRPGF